MLKRILSVLFVSLAFMSAGAQTKWLNPLENGAEVHGQGWSELRHTYNRLPQKAEGVVPESVWWLSKHSAGLSLRFRTDASSLTIRYGVSEGLAYPHMQTTGKSGLDLYIAGDNGRSVWVSPDFLPSFGDTLVYGYSHIPAAKEKSGTLECRLYLPLYNSVKWLEVGVPEGSHIAFEKDESQKPIVVYGTSIAQGACASRPSMAWTTILERKSGRQVVNLGFSGSGRMEPELFDLLSEIDAGMYIIDCLPNLDAESPIVELTLNGCHKLREKHDCPILLVEHNGYPGTPTSAERVDVENGKLREAYRTLLAEGVRDIHYLSTEEFDFGPECTVEGVHPNDMGMMRMADAHLAKITGILPQAKPMICSQWNGRKVAFIGDSITDPNQVKYGMNRVYWQDLQVMLGIEPLVYAVNGYQLSQAVELAQKMEAECGQEPDAILMLLGTNDYNSSVPMGEWYTLENVKVNVDGKTVTRRHRTFSFDGETFRGRLNTAIRYLKTHYPTKQIILMTPIHRDFASFGKWNVQPDENYANGQGLFVEAYADAVREAGKLWAVPVIDLSTLCGLNPTLPEYLGYFRNPETDHLHPNTEGHRRMASAIAYQLLGLPAWF